VSVLTKQARIAKLAGEAPHRVLTTLNHHLDIAWLYEAHRRTRKDAAPGVDGVCGHEYASSEEELQAHLQSLLDRAKSGTFKAPPVRREHIPKGTGGETRPIGIPVFESKVLERAVVMLLEPIYEQDFYECSYGFRRNRGPHDALEALREQIMGMKGCWLIDADVRKYFDSVNFRHLRGFLDRRVRDGVIRKLIDKWLKAGVWEEGQVYYPECGTPQGGVISPLLSNIYLHEVLDTWFHEVVLPRMRGRVFLIRFADDFVIGCERQEDAERIMTVLPKRFEKYGLTIHPEKTRLVDFRSPAKQAGGGKPGTFDFLGFTHYWGTSRRNWPVVKRRTAKDRLQRAATALTSWCKQNRHRPIREQAETLSTKLQGHFQYYGLTGNSHQLGRLRHTVVRTWFKWLNRRGGGKPMNWKVFNARILANYPLPPVRITMTVDRINQRRADRKGLPGLLPAIS